MNENIKNDILSFARGLGIPVCGISGDGKTYSRIVCLFPYYTDKDEGGNLSLYARGKDYHTICGRYLLKIADYIKEQIPYSNTLIHVDKGEGDDKKAAYLAGLGFYGRNTLLINETYGSFVFIGYIETDAVLPPDTPLETECISCGKCEAACPGGALSGGVLDITKCASHISQKKGELSFEEKEIMKKSGLIWGCDICQTVCPHNKGTPKTPLKAFTEDTVSHLSSLPETNKAFLALYGDRAFSWRGKNLLSRNLEILSGNTNKDKGS